jgi:hypothetical protein
MQASVCQLRHKTNAWRTSRGTRQDLAACFTWKEVALRFFNLALRLEEAGRRVLHVVPSQISCEDQIEDGWVDEMGCVEPYYIYFTILCIRP